jgi:hypothetical protein
MDRSYAARGVMPPKPNAVVAGLDPAMTENLSVLREQRGAFRVPRSRS